MKSLAIARRYARALLLIGKEDDKVETYGEELDRLAGLIAREKELKQVINNPVYDPAERRKVLQAVIKELNLSSTTSSFLLLLFDKGRIRFLNDINDFYQKLVDELKGIIRASLVSATELSPETVERIRTALSETTGKDIILEVDQNPGLIGGVVSKIGDLVLDGSIRTQLFNMRESLKRGEGI